jgi:pyridoxine 5-phosphate synthase
VEGYPSAAFVEAVLSNRPDQCTLVPDAPGQITSDHGWNVEDSAGLLGPVIERLRAAGIRSSLFVDYTMQGFETARRLGADRVELYTEPYAQAWEDHGRTPLLDAFAQAAGRAQAAGLGVNAGHDLNLDNLKDFLTIPGILEVSIGHALVVECIEWGIEHVIRRYVALVAASV